LSLRERIKEQIGNLAFTEFDFLLLVESESDIIFWSNILTKCDFKFNPKISPGVKIDNSEERNKGKKIILRCKPFCIDFPLKIAIDSDYDYLLNRGNFNIQNHILQTYTYSIENYFCYAPSLENLCLTATQSKSKNVFNFKKFLKEYSKIIYPIFIISLLYEKNKEQFDEHNFYSISNFCDDVFIDYQLVRIKDITESLNDIEDHVTNKFDTLKINFSDEDFETVKNNIETKGVTEENCYLFIQGHFLLENFLSPIIKNMTTQLSIEVGTGFTDNKVKNKYFSNLKNSPDLLKSNYNFIDCNIFPKVKADVSALQQLM